MSFYPGGDDASGLPQNGGTWRGGFHIGEGGSGSIHYWVNVDKNERVQDRMVIKDMKCKESIVEPDDYRGVYQDIVRKGMDFGIAASGKSGEATTDERFLREAYLQAMMTNPDDPSSATTVPLRGFKKGHMHNSWPDKDTGEQVTETHWRIYMDLFYAGDLHSIILKHQKGEDGKKNPIPEPFIWWVFTCIATALVQMDSCVQNRTAARVEKDESLVIVDMKSLNILLDATRRTQYPVYPKPLLSDLGSARILYKEHPLQNKFACVATNGFFAPEMIKKDQIDESWSQGIEKPLHSWSNVWQAGRTIESMMQVRVPVRPDHDLIGVEDCPIKTTDPVNIEGFPDFKYSEDLTDLTNPTELLGLVKSYASKHSRGIDIWGNEEWIAEQEKHGKPGKVGIPPPSLSTDNLDFLAEYPDQSLADRYRRLGMNIPKGCALVYSGGRDPNKIGDTIFMPEQKDPMDGHW